MQPHRCRSAAGFKVTGPQLLPVFLHRKPPRSTPNQRITQLATHVHGLINPPPRPTVLPADHQRRTRLPAYWPVQHAPGAASTVQARGRWSAPVHGRCAVCGVCVYRLCVRCLCACPFRRQHPAVWTAAAELLFGEFDWWFFVQGFHWEVE